MKRPSSIAYFAFLSTLACASSPSTVSEPSSQHAVDASASIHGIATNSTTNEPIQNAIVQLHCPCLDAPLETRTDERGHYRFRGLVSGRYHAAIQTKRAKITKITKLPPGATFWANFKFDPAKAQNIEVMVEASPAKHDAPAQFIHPPAEHSTSRDARPLLRSS